MFMTLFTKTISPFISKFLSKTALTSLGKIWKDLAIAVLLLLFAYQNLSGTRWVFWADTIPFLRSELTVAEYELDLIKDANTALVSVIDERNAEIKKWNEVSQSLRQNTRDLQVKISSLNSSTRERILEIEKDVIDHGCTAAMEYLYDSIPELNYKKGPGD